MSRCAASLDFTGAASSVTFIPIKIQSLIELILHPDKYI
jgi:hypothetical protein